MSIMARFQHLGRTWLAIRHAAGEARGIRQNMSDLQLKYGFNAANAEEACEDDEIFERWLQWRDQFEVANLKLGHLMIEAEADGSLALISQIITKINVKVLS